MAIASKWQRELYIILENSVHIILFTNQYVYFSIVFNQNFETVCPKLKIVKSLGVLLFKGDHPILRLQPLACIYSSK